MSLHGSDRRFVLVSAMPWIAGAPSTEEDPLPAEDWSEAVAAPVNAGLALASHRVRTSAAHIPRTVHNHDEGRFARLLTRHEAHVVRLAALYAALDCSAEIRLPHLEAALAVWRYSLDAAR